jgi:calcium-binding protein CML
VFDELIDAFLFFDKDGDGKMKRKDVTQRMNEESHQERTPSHITAQLFSSVHTLSTPAPSLPLLLCTACHSLLVLNLQRRWTSTGTGR